VTRTVGADGEAARRSVRAVDRHTVDPNVMKQVATGEAVVLSIVDGRRVATLRVLPPVSVGAT
jgi:hypothetical protein